MNAQICYFGQTLVLASPASGRAGWALAVPARLWEYGRYWRRAKQQRILE
ncbi:MAG: hypothetical protein GY803_13575 [Chloroflexi bacterium]|nr:hypothetical protein [Chloroflexota bacterium]